MRRYKLSAVRGVLPAALGSFDPAPFPWVEIENSLGSLLGHLNEVPEPRQQSKIDYPLDEILLLTISAVVSGCSEWQEIVDFGEDKLSWLRKYRPFSNGIPSHDTLNRAVSLIDSEAFEKIFVNWVNHNITLPEGTLISIDGKKLRGSASKLAQQTSRADGGKSSSPFGRGMVQ